MDNITNATPLATRSPNSQNSTHEFPAGPSPASSPNTQIRNAARPEAKLAAQSSAATARSASARKSARCDRRREGKFGGRSKRASSVPFVDVAEGATADEVAAAEPRLDGGRHRRRVRHASLPRDPAAGLGFWRAGIAARRLPPGARVWIRGGVVSRYSLPPVSPISTGREIWRWCLVCVCSPGRAACSRWGGEVRDAIHCRVGPILKGLHNSIKNDM